MAARLAYDGYDVALYDRSHSRIAPFQHRRRIELRGEIEGVGEFAYIGTDLATAVANRDIIIIVTTATAHRPLARQLAPCLKEGQIILLKPGRTFGALEVSRVIRAAGCTAEVIVGEANTLIYVSRVIDPGIVLIKAVKKRVLVSAVRACNTPYLLDRLRDVYPQFAPARSFLETSLGNIGARLHPAISLGNADRISSGESFDFYTSVTPPIARTLTEVDRELWILSRVLGVRSLSIKEWLHSRYSIERADLATMLRSNPGYQNIKAPTTLDHRYLWDDIPTGLVPVSEIARALGVETPTR
ncbi:unnamed protein product, partial [marine sediment metagenome]